MAINQSCCPNGYTGREEAEMEGYKLVIRNNIYVSLYFKEQFLHCYDNCSEYGEEIMAEIEKRTGMNFYDIPVEMPRDFEEFRFLGLRGWHSFYSDEVKALKR